MQGIESAPVKTVAPPKPESSDLVGRFSEEYGRTLSGVYGRLEIDNCENFTLKGVTAQSISITSSTVEIENSRIAGGRIALKAYDSNITITGGTLDGDVAIAADSSELDLAGVQFRGRRALIETGDRVKFVFSISKAHLGDQVWYLHGVEELSPELLPWPKSDR